MSALSFPIARTVSQAITGLGDLTGYKNIWFTAKAAFKILNKDSWIHIDKTTGLLYIAGGGGVAAKGSITIDDLVLGNLTLSIDASEMGKLEVVRGRYDVAWCDANDAIETLREDAFETTGYPSHSTRSPRRMNLFLFSKGAWIPIGNCTDLSVSPADQFQEYIISQDRIQNAKKPVISQVIEHIRRTQKRNNESAGYGQGV